MWNSIKKAYNIFSIIFSIGLLLAVLHTFHWNFSKFWNFLMEPVYGISATAFVLFLIVCWNIDTLNEKLDDLKKQKSE